MALRGRGPVVVIRIIGVALLFLGIVGALVAPAEMHAFSLFQAGGRFHYEGFGLGSLMFANIAIQIAGYYVIAAICIPLGYGHLKLRWWASPAMTTLMVGWLLVGFPLALIALLIFIQSKGVTPLSLPFVVLGFLLIYPVLPILLLRFYKRPAVKRALKTDDSPSNWLSRTPLAVRVAGSLMVLLALVLHFPLLFGGVFPLFGRITLGLPGILALDLAIATTVFLNWGVLRRKGWAWWGSVSFLGLVLSASTLTFLVVPPQEILAQMPLAPMEAEALSGVPIRGYHLALFFGAIPAVILATLVAARRDFFPGPGNSYAP
jgi:hypothetical protein